MEPTPNEIQGQLERILNTESFRSSQRLADFLRYVVDETLAGRADQINQRSVGVKGLGYAANFDPQTSPVVRVLGRRLRRALDQYYYTHGVDDPIRITIPIGRYVPVFLPHDKVSPAAEHAPEELGFTPFQTQLQVEPPNGPSVAVLPLEYLGNDAEYAYLASGITEEIVVALTQFPDFVVVGPLNRDIIKREHQGPRDIGREHNVRFLLDGTVRLRGRSLRIVARLTDARSGSQMWGQAHDYDLETSSINQIDDDVVGRVAATIADSYGVIPRALTKESMVQRADSLSDYEAILRFHHLFSVFTPQAFNDAFAALEKTLERDPDNAMAAGMLADLYASMYQLGFEDSMSFVDKAEKLGRKAVALDPNCQPARYTMALIHYLKGERALFLEEAEQCLQLNPNSALYSAALAVHLYMAGERERGAELIHKAMRLNPHQPGWFHLVSYMEQYRQGEYDLALVEAQRFNIPTFYFDPLIRAAVLGQLGRREEASKTVDELLVLVPDFERRGRSLIRRFAYLEEHVEMLAEGLRKAGLDVVD